MRTPFSLCGQVLIVLIADCWHDEPDEPLLQPGALNTMAKHDAYCELRKRALADGFDQATFDTKRLQAFRGERVEAGRLCCFRPVATTSAQLVNYGKYRPSKAETTSVETKSTQELTGESRCGLKMCSRFTELIVGGWEIGRVLDTSMSRSAMPQGTAAVQGRSGTNTSLSKVDVNIAWRSSVELHRQYANSEGEVAARYEKTKTATDLDPVNARLPSATAFETRLLANRTARQSLDATIARQRASGSLRAAEQLVTTEQARDPPDAARLLAAQTLATRVGVFVDTVNKAATTAQEAGRAAEQAAMTAMRSTGSTGDALGVVATGASARAKEAAERATAAANEAASLVAAAPTA